MTMVYQWRLDKIKIKNNINVLIWIKNATQSPELVYGHHNIFI